MLWSSPFSSLPPKKGVCFEVLTHTQTHTTGTQTLVQQSELGLVRLDTDVHSTEKSHFTASLVGGGLRWEGREKDQPPEKKINSKISTKWHHAGLSLKKDTPDEDIWSLRTIT